MDRRPISEEQGRAKRHKTESMEPRYNGESDDDGGVKLEPYGQAAQVKHKREELDAKSSNYADGKDTPIGKATSEKRKKEEDSDDASDPYLTQQYEGPARKRQMDPRGKPYPAHRHEEPVEDESIYNKAISNKRKKEKDSDDASDPYLTQQYEGPARKKQMDPRANPYLAHRYEEPVEDESIYNGYTNGFARTTKRVEGPLKASSVAGFPRHKSTAAMAKKAEDGPNNPFNGQPLSTQYFSILKTRRDLPVHQQRYAQRALQPKRHVLTPCIGTNSYRCIRSRNFSYSSEKLVPGRRPKYLNLSFSMINHTFSASWWLARNLAEWQLCQ